MIGSDFANIKHLRIGSRARPTLNQLFQLARSRCREEYRQLGGTEKEFSHIEYQLSDPHNDGRAIVLVALRASMHRGSVKDLRDFNGFVRELQALANHAVFAISGDFMSRFFYAVLESKDFQVTRQPRDVIAYLRLCLDAHRAVDAFIDFDQQEYARAMADLRAFLSKLKPEPVAAHDTDLRSVKESRNFRSVIHHALDWYLMVVGRNAVRRSPRQLAALAIGVVGRVHSIVTGYAARVTLKRLAAYGGWKGASSLSGALFGVFYDIIYSVRDIPLLFYQTNPEPDNWFERLANVAPALRDRPINGSTEFDN